MYFTVPSAISMSEIHEMPAGAQVVFERVGDRSGAAMFGIVLPRLSRGQEYCKVCLVAIELSFRENCARSARTEHGAAKSVYDMIPRWDMPSECDVVEVTRWGELAFDACATATANTASLREERWRYVGPFSARTPYTVEVVVKKGIIHSLH